MSGIELVTYTSNYIEDENQNCIGKPIFRVGIFYLFSWTICNSFTQYVVRMSIMLNALVLLNIRILPFSYVNSPQFTLHFLIIFILYYKRLWIVLKKRIYEAINVFPLKVVTTEFCGGPSSTSPSQQSLDRSVAQPTKSSSQLLNANDNSIFHVVTGTIRFQKIIWESYHFLQYIFLAVQ